MATMMLIAATHLWYSIIGNADPQGDLLADFVSIAQFLQLPEKDEPNQALIVDALKQWFQQHEGWLLLFDNVEDITAVNALRPTAGRGHMLITTRAQATGTIATPCEIEPMDLQEGAEFLLRRVKFLSPDLPLDQVESQERVAAEEISRLFGGHPLALDQAGAYVEETGQHLSDYLNLYQQRQTTLLSRRGDTSTDHLASVMTNTHVQNQREQHMDISLPAMFSKMLKAKDP